VNLRNVQDNTEKKESSEPTGIKTGAFMVLNIQRELFASLIGCWTANTSVCQQLITDSVAQNVSAITAVITGVTFGEA